MIDSQSKCPSLDPSRDSNWNWLLLTQNCKNRLVICDKCELSAIYVDKNALFQTHKPNSLSLNLGAADSVLEA